MVIQKSIERFFNEYKDVSIDDITQVQANYYAKRPDKIRQILHKAKYIPPKDNLTKPDTYGMALGRIANQYIAHLSDVKQKELNVAKKQNIRLTKNFSENLQAMGNKSDFKLSKTTQKEIDKKEKVIRLSSKYFTELGNKHEQFLKNNQKVYNKYRVKLELISSKGKSYVQTFSFPLSAYGKFDYLIRRMKGVIESETKYSTHDKNRKDALIYSINRIILEVMR